MSRVQTYLIWFHKVPTVHAVSEAARSQPELRSQISLHLLSLTVHLCSAGGGPEPESRRRRHVQVVPGEGRLQRGAQVEAHAPLRGPVLLLSAASLHGARLAGGGTQFCRWRYHVWVVEVRRRAIVDSVDSVYVVPCDSCLVGLGEMVV